MVWVDPHHNIWYTPRGVEFTLLVLVSAGNALLCAFLGWYTHRSRPAALLRSHSDLVRRMMEVEQSQLAVQSEFLTARKELESLHEAIIDDLERAERKRRQATARAQRAEQAAGRNGEVPPPGSAERMSYLRQLARSRGL